MKPLPMTNTDEKQKFNQNLCENGVETVNTIIFSDKNDINNRAAIFEVKYCDIRLLKNETR